MENMIKHIGPLMLTNDEKALLLEISKKYKDYSSFSFYPNLESEMMIDWPDLTPLITAIINNEDFKVLQRFYFKHRKEIAQQLYKEETDNFEDYACENWSENVLISQIVLILTEKGLNSERIGTTLSNFVDYPTTLIRLGNLEIIRAYLPLIRPEETFSYQDSIFKLLVKKADPQFLELFLQHRPDHFDGMNALFEVIINCICDLNAHETGRAFIKIPLKFELYHETSIYFLERVLIRAARENLEIFFNYEYRLFIKSKVNDRDIMACVFGNCNTGVLELLKTVKIDLNARGTEDRTCLHFAAQESLSENIRFLLSRGADPNALDQFNRTPLKIVLFNNTSFFGNRSDENFRGEDCMKQLLIGGTNILSGYRSNESWPKFFGIDTFDLRHNSLLYPNLINLLLAQLAIYEARGLSIEKPMKDYKILQEAGYDKNCYDECREQLEQLKSHKYRTISDYCDRKFSMFALLSEKIDLIARHINEEDQNEIASFMKKYKEEKLLLPFYYETLEKHIEVINQISRLIHETKKVLSECMNISNMNHLVINEIVNYLTIQDFFKVK